jgi:hypothetical protein
MIRVRSRAAHPATMRHRSGAPCRAALRAALLAALLASPASPLAAQQEHAGHSHGATPAADSAGRAPAPNRRAGGDSTPTTSMVTPMASGTAWVPLSSAVRGAHVMVGEWMLMLHGVAYGQYMNQEGRRGGWQFGSINWLMLSAAHPTSGGRVEFRAMGSAEPYTLGKVGYPLLLQTGETYAGVPLHDRQHPHDLAMEISTTLEQRIAGPVSASLYLAPVGEPAAGPVAFMHRPSADGDPFAPLSHHWQDGGHVTFGVVTAGLFTDHVRLEGSLFNGREPDEVRTNFDFRGRSLDSWSARLTLRPSRNWALSGWYAYLDSPEALFPADWNRHVGASVLHSHPIGRDGSWSSAIIWGAKRHEPSNHHPITRLTHSLTAESSLQLGRRNTLFARGEYVQKDMEELFLPHVREQIHEVRSVAAGYVVDVAQARSATLGIGVRGAVSFIPDTLALYYGSRRPVGGAVFARLGFARARSGEARQPEHDMNHMEHASARRVEPMKPSGHAEHAGR